MNIDSPACVVLAGGVALGAYQAGAYEILEREPGVSVGWIAGSSVGAINGALIAGSPCAERLAALRGYWLGRWGWSQAAAVPIPGGMLRHAANWMSVLQARMFGAPGHLQAAGPRLQFSSFYDLGPTAEYLRKVVDFGRLNGGELRLTVAATDIQTGDLVTFDSRRERIAIDHLLASCGFLPEFAPVELGGRLLGDGGLAANAPVEPVLDETEGSDATVFVIDLFARDGPRPSGLQAALERKNGLIYGNQTYRRLDLYRRLWKRQERSDPLPTILYLSYRPAATEAAPDMTFDFSPASATDRWTAGSLDMQEALSLHDAAKASGAVLTSVRRNASPDA